MNVAVKTNTERPFGDLFAAARGRLPGTGAVAEVRQEAFDDFARAGLPHRRIEEWKYTDLRALLRDVAPLAPAPDQAALARAAEAVLALEIGGTLKLVLVDGVFAPRCRASPRGGRHSRPLAARGARGHQRQGPRRPACDRCCVRCHDRAQCRDGDRRRRDRRGGRRHAGEADHIVHVATGSGTSVFTRSLLRIGKGARVTWWRASSAPRARRPIRSNDSVAISVGDDAELQHVRLMEDARDAANVTTGTFVSGANVKLNSFGLTTRQRQRYQGFVAFNGEGSSLATNGVNLLGGRRHGDTTLVVDHKVPNCMSREVFRAVLDGQGHSVFQGRIIVRPDAQKTDG